MYPVNFIRSRELAIVIWNDGSKELLISGSNLDIETIIKKMSWSEFQKVGYFKYVNIVYQQDRVILYYYN